MSAQPDFIIRDEGTIVMFCPRSQEAIDWWQESVEEANTLGRYYAVDHRMAQAICIGIMEADFSVGMED